MTAIVDAGQVVASIGQRILGRTALDNIDNPVTGERIVDAGKMILEPDVGRDRKGRYPVRPHSFGTDLRNPDRRLRRLLRPGPRPRYACQHGRSRRRHRGSVDRRAGHAADHGRTFHLGGTATVVDQSFLGSLL